MENKSKGQVLVVPYPMQGHAIPMMKLSENIASHGVKVTLIITEHNYKGMMSRSMIDLRDGEKTSRVHLVTVPDGLEPDDDRKNHAKVYGSIAKVMPGHVYDLVSKAKQNQGENDHFTCMVVSPIFGWAPKIADDIGIKLALFWTSSPGTLISTLMTAELVNNGFIDQQGIPIKKEAIKLLSDFPNMEPTELPWYNHLEGTLGKNDMFNVVVTSEQVLKRAKWVLCNWSEALIPSLAQLRFSNLLSIGPLLGDTQHNETLYPEDSACFTWLDQQPSKSVIYVAFGSFLSLTQAQINELAHGLELSGRRFLWALRADMSSNSTVQLPDGFEARIANCGKLVEWASQEKVLAHSSIACFVTHCGWNSTIEGMSYGVPMLCWPCFADQPYTRTCICEGWRIGLSLVTEVNKGVITANDVRSKIDELLSRQDLIENSLKIKETIKTSVSQGGSSFEAMQSFIKQAQF
ncbi:UDP-glycosyltransferase 83A1-like [Silene latifolia]|uniref:UDP-glycosyltransferase 83A1-like n=1 Tax=Silene latifolia TaxID=37657 RepID=UPI003D76C8E7